MIFAIIDGIIAFRSNNSSTLLLNIITFFICLLIVIFTPKLALKNLLNFDRKLHNEANVHPETIVTFDDKIKLTEGEQVTTIDYSQVNMYIRLKSFSVLMFTKQNGIMFREDKFTIGNKEDFEKFIFEKCHNVKSVIER